MGNIQRMQKVMRVIDEDIRPRLAQDGGDIELVDMEGTKVVVAMRRGLFQLSGQSADHQGSGGKNIA